MRLDQDPSLSSFGIGRPVSGPGSVSPNQRLVDEASAVIAVDGSTPLKPRPEMLADIHCRIEPVSGEGSTKLRVAAWSGWAVAIGLSAACVWQMTHHHSGNTDRTAASPAIDTSKKAAVPKAHPETQAGEDSTTLLATQSRMSQEISALREQLKLLTNRDTDRLLVTQGVSCPVIMKLSQPGIIARVSEIDSVFGVLLDHGQEGDDSRDPILEVSGDETAPTTEDGANPVAVPIYDPARDRGQLILGNMPALDKQEAYHLWARSHQSSQPVLVGTLPTDLDSVSATIDFRLGSNGIVPENFWITRDARETPKAPSEENIVLQGPGAP